MGFLTTFLTRGGVVIRTGTLAVGGIDGYAEVLT